MIFSNEIVKHQMWCKTAIKLMLFIEMRWKAISVLLKDGLSPPLLQCSQIFSDVFLAAYCLFGLISYGVALYMTYFFVLHKHVLI